MEGRRRRKTRGKQSDTKATAEKTESYTLPPSPPHSFSSSSSSDFEFSISISPRKSSTLLCPADELFYKGQLLPLHLSPRISMVRSLLLSSPPSSYSAPRDSTASTTSSSSFITNDCDSSRPSSATDEDNHFINRHNHHINNNGFICNKKTTTTTNSNNNNRYFSFSRFSSVFRKARCETESVSVSEPSSSVKRMGNTAREVIRKYLKKVKKPLSGKFSQKHQKTMSQMKTERSANETGVCFVKNKKEVTGSNNTALVCSSYSSHSFSGNLRYPRRRNSNYVSSCPSSMGSSPTRYGVLSRSCYSDASTMEELQNAIQGAITHCKNSLVQNTKTTVSDEI